MHGFDHQKQNEKQFVLNWQLIKSKSLWFFNNDWSVLSINPLSSPQTIKFYIYKKNQQSTEENKELYFPHELFHIRATLWWWVALSCVIVYFLIISNTFWPDNYYSPRYCTDSIITYLDKTAIVYYSSIIPHLLTLLLKSLSNIASATLKHINLGLGA